MSERHRGGENKYVTTIVIGSERTHHAELIELINLVSVLMGRQKEELNPEWPVYLAFGALSIEQNCAHTHIQLLTVQRW